MCVCVFDRKRFQETELRIRKHIDEQLLRQQQEDQGQREKLPNAYSELDEQSTKQVSLLYLPLRG